MNDEINQEAALVGRYYIQAGSSYYEFRKGYRARIVPISTSLLLEVQRNFPQPEPPLVRIDRGDGEYITEENPADPEYQRARTKWAVEVEEKYIEALIALGAVAEKIDQPALEKTRAVMRRIYNIELNEDDNYCFLKYVCPSSDEEYQDFISAVQGRSKPREAAIARAIENFSGNIQG